ncbi:DUF2243 domain-containing protein [Amycolatopsis sp. WAC 01376]|uniref:DUF2243 domain-containing protein n=1 Tax=Amycolatopsis sp. WAC 01376 TaxID=2203195 RepID=UPI000F7982C7|nr:DUF2243 domain-containing protein [Amycolatopsis sp. WAC 01376]RSM56162.1 DUF2243 domain-containing protein [Amycolatopsis sp. WAC 01376]
MRLPASSLLLGSGFGGFVDGIVAHQILGWHHMLSSWYPPDTPEDLHLNMVGDGLFHLLCLIFVVLGVVLLNRGNRLPGPVLWGGALAGWGVFNLVEGTVDHLILGVHHVRPGAHQTAYDLGFLVLGAVLVAIGTLMARQRESLSSA